MVRFDTDQPKKKLAGQLTWFLLWAFVTTVGLILTPSSDGHGTHTQLGLPTCASVALFDRPCFGCGMTTSFTATLHLDFVAAWAAHPFGTLMYVIFTVSALFAIWGFVKRIRVNTDTVLFNRSIIALTVVFVIFGVVRFATTTYGSDTYALIKAARELGSGEERR